MSGTPEIASLEDLRAKIFRPETFALPTGDAVEIHGISKERSMVFADRLESLSGAGELYAVAADMIAACVRPELSDEEALALYNFVGGLGSDFFAAVARRCGVADHIRIMRNAIPGLAEGEGEDPTRPEGKGRSTDGSARTSHS